MIRLCRSGLQGFPVSTERPLVGLSRLGFEALQSSETHGSACSVRALGFVNYPEIDLEVAWSIRNGFPSEQGADLAGFVTAGRIFKPGVFIVRAGI